MQISYCKEADAVAIWFQGVESDRTIDISEDIFIDVDKNGRLAGVEILHASEKFNVMDLLNISIQLPNQEKLTIQLPNFIGTPSGLAAIEKVLSLNGDGDYKEDAGD